MSQATKTSEVLSRVRNFSEALNEGRKSAEKHHMGVQEHAKKSQEVHERMVELSKSIDALRKAHQETHKLFLETKKKFAAANDALKKKLHEVAVLSDEVDKINAQEQLEKKKQREIDRKQKEDELTSKIKKGKKLTTDDFLALQMT